MHQTYNTDTSNRASNGGAYDHEPTLYGLSEEDNQKPLKLYEEELVAERNRVKNRRSGRRQASRNRDRNRNRSG